MTVNDSNSLQGMVRPLLQLTQAGAVTWEEHPGTRRYIARVRNAVVGTWVTRDQDGDAIAVLALVSVADPSQSDFEELESLYVGSWLPPDEKEEIFELVEAARRSALGVDKLLAQLADGLAELQAERGSPDDIDPDELPF